MKQSPKSRFLFALAALLFVLPTPAFAWLPPLFREGWDPDFVKVVLTAHIFGVIFWIGGLGVRLLLLGSINSAINDVARIQLYEIQRRLFRVIEVPAFLLALVTGLTLVYSDIDTYHLTRFMIKMVSVAGAVVLDIVATRQFEGLKATGRQGRASAFSLVLIVMTVIMLLASTAYFRS